ncbi:response regulator transcription factor [Cohnella sp. 56]|uniref:response regulator transcription factor n=1 Tax=Cohnella sp. 56 TaxID=3113722 RepID=UPI0030E87973
MLHPVLLVDDEPSAIKSVKYLLDWEQYGFRIAGEAASGRQALEALKSQTYALVLTDIRMPGMDGLELVAHVRQFSQVPVIIMSGYSDFGYVKQSLGHGVKDYLLKPVEEDDLARLLHKLKLEIEHQALVDKQLYFGVPALRDQMLKRWVQGAGSGEEIVEHFPLAARLRPEGRALCALTVEMDFMDARNDRMLESDIQIKRFAVRNVIEDLIAGEGYAFEEDDEHLGVLLVGPRERLTERHAAALAAAMHENVERYAKVPVAVGTGSIVHRFAEAEQSFRRARNRLEMRFLFGSSGVLTEAQESRAPASGDSDGWQIAPILESLNWSHAEELSRLLRDKWSRMNDRYSEETMKAVVLEMFVELYRLLKERGLDGDGLFASPLRDYRAIMDAKTMEGLLQFVERRCLDVAEALNVRPQPQPAQTVEQVKQLVKQQYAQSICLKDIAEQIYMNPGYLGRLFKAHEGMPFNEYLLQVRMEKAKALLRETDMKVYAIASEVGYGDIDWFYKRFKQYAGVSASEYRTWRLGSGERDE